MLPAQDHKKIFDNDEGPNTGGVGAYCPCPLLDQNQLQCAQKNILEKIVIGMKKENIKFLGKFSDIFQGIYTFNISIFSIISSNF